MPDEDLSYLAPMQCGHRGCPSEARWRPLVLIFLRKSLFGLQSPLGLRPYLRSKMMCDRHKRDVKLRDVLDDERLEIGLAFATILQVAMQIDKSQTRLEWEEI